ncbi:Serine/threonine protein kinase [Entomophthora muscae]|uniref:Serine/threonine protein kinase n=1 Tax=Entomophthora muscae TaxID=34485 RepID=A0ACC2UUJ0_9FUNG|nr:Serine/threonine protein kinase [Entomophthora muscae]
MSSPPEFPKYIGGCRYQLLQLLGYGANGQVFLGLDCRSSTKVAIKQLPRRGLTPHERRIQDNEASFHQALSHHHNILTLHCVIEENDALYLVLDYCPMGDLFEHVVRQTSLQRKSSQEQNRTMALDIISAVMDCHASGIYHRDLKPENILLMDNEIRLADFGLATTERCSSDVGCGSACYMSPECHMPGPKGVDSAKNDVWSLGIILVNLMSGLNPWKQASVDDDSFRAYLEDQTYLLRTLGISPTFYHLLTRALDVDPGMRCSLPELYALVDSCPTFLASPLQLKTPPPLVTSDEFNYDSDSVYTTSSPVNPIFSLPDDLNFDKDGLYAMYFDHTNSMNYLDQLDAEL